MKRLAGKGLSERKRTGMQSKAPWKGRKLCAIQIIAYNGTADMGEMDTDLMGAPGLKAQTKERTAAVNGFQPVKGAGGFSFRGNGAFCSGTGMCNGRVDDAGRKSRNMVRNGEIFPAE